MASAKHFVMASGSGIEPLAVAVRDTIHASSGLAGLLRECPMKALAISMVAGAALCSLMSVPASAMPMSNLAATASDLALGQSVRYGHHHYRYRLGRGGYYAYGAVSPPWSRRFGDNHY
jgi:hypothetical protein